MQGRLRTAHTSFRSCGRTPSRVPLIWKG